MHKYQKYSKFLKKTIDFFQTLCYNKIMIKIAILQIRKTVMLSGSESKFTEILLNMLC